MTGITHAPYRFAFVMEQTLGHVTHYRNLRAAVDADPAVDASWYPLGFPPRGALETLPPVRGNWSVRSSLRARRLLARDGAASRYDALFFHTQVTTLFNAPLMARVPAVISLDATPLNYDTVGSAYGHQPGSGVMERAKLWLNRRALHAGSAYVTWCDWARRSLIDDYGVDGARITVIPPGVDLAQWPAPTHRPDAGPVRILFVGGDFARKGGETLLAAYRARLGDRCELHLVTKAEIAPEPGVHVYHDVAPNSELLKRLYATADIFALPTLADCFPLVIQEAMAAGLPVIATNVGAIGEAVRDSETGLLVPPSDVGALSTALEALAGDAQRRSAIGACGRAFAERHYDSTANAGRIVAVLTQIADGRRNSAILPRS